MSDILHEKAITNKLSKSCLTKHETVLMVENYGCMFPFSILC